jgi:Protein of unknown function (DUF1769)
MAFEAASRISLPAIMTVMRYKSHSIGSTTLSESSTSLEEVETNTMNILQAERLLFRFFNLPLPLDHPSACNQQHQLLQIPTSSGTCTSEPFINQMPQKWWCREQQSNSHEEQDQKQQFSPVQPSSYTPPYQLPPHPSSWPQRPVWIRASPGTSTHIVGIRHVPGDLSDDVSFFDSHPDLVPVNAGCEAPGHCIVVDFVSKHFVGSVLIRIRGIPSLVVTSSGITSQNYHGTRQRTFQGVVRGRFRHAQPVYDCLSGQTFRRPAGKLPAPWIVKAFQALLARLAPHNVLILDGPRPRSLAPLISTTQTILVTPLNNNDLNATESQQSSPQPQNQQQQSGLQVLHEGQLFFDSVYDNHINYCYSSNDAVTMEQEFVEPHASHEHSMIYQATKALQPEDLADVNPPFRHDDSQKNRKFRKKYFNRLLTKWKQKRKRELCQQSAKRDRKHHHQVPQKDVDDNDNDGHRHEDHHLDYDDDGGPPLPNFVFATDKQYTFEFYEHLVLFDNPQKEFAVNLRLPLLRHIPIAPATDGQPIQMMAALRKRRESNQQPCDEDDDETIAAGWDDELDYLWAFEVWHESLYDYACRAHATRVDSL